MPVFSGSSISKSNKKTLAKKVYLDKILVGVLFSYRAASREACEGCIVSFKVFKAIIWITNVSELLSKVTLTNLCLLISSICVAINKTLVKV